MPLNNFTYVTRTSGLLYRGARPDEVGLRCLYSIGIDTIYCIDRKCDAVQVDGFGHDIIFDYFPQFSLSHVQLYKAAGKLKELLDSGRKVYLHGTFGGDRTGIVVAAYRILYEGTTFTQAKEEMKQFRLSFNTLYIRDIDFNLAWITANKGIILKGIC